MFGVSLLFTMAHAFSITRYKLMEVEDIVNRSVVYFAFSLVAGLIYSVMLLIGGKLIGDRLFSPHSTTGGAIVAAFSVIVVLTLFEVARGRFQRVIDRRFFREKYKFDEAMNKMRLAVGSLVDRVTLGRRLLEAAGEVLRLEWGALYLLEASDQTFRLVACHGPTPDEETLADEQPAGRAPEASADRPPLARGGARRRGRSGERCHDRPGWRGRHRVGWRWCPCRAAGPRPEAERHALRERGDGLPRGTQLRRHARPPLGGHPGDAQEPQPGAARSRWIRSPSSSGVS